jgi:hypothetical protein
LKILNTYIKKLYKIIDISPFSFGKIKLLIFLLWGLNALVYLDRDRVYDNNVSPEQLTIISREFFDYNNITTGYEDLINVNLEPCFIGIIIDSGLQIQNPFEFVFNPNRAPPVVS